MEKALRAVWIDTDLCRDFDAAARLHPVRLLDERHHLGVRRSERRDIALVEEKHAHDTMCRSDAGNGEMISQPPSRTMTCSSAFSSPSTVSIFGSGVMLMPDSRTCSSNALRYGG